MLSTDGYEKGDSVEDELKYYENSTFADLSECILLEPFCEDEVALIPHDFPYGPDGAAVPENDDAKRRFIVDLLIKIWKTPNLIPFGVYKIPYSVPYC